MTSAAPWNGAFFLAQQRAAVPAAAAPAAPEEAAAEPAPGLFGPELLAYMAIGVGVALVARELSKLAKD